MDMLDTTSPEALAETEAAEKVAKAKAPRKKAMLGIGGAVLFAGIGYGGYEYFVGSRHVSTDNAYVGAYTASVTPMIDGQITDVMVSDAQTVRKGDILFRIDDRDARIALAQAEADLAKMRRQFGQTSASGSALSAQIGARDADIARARAQMMAAQADVAKARIDYQRRATLQRIGAVSGDELTSASGALANANAALSVARAAAAQAVATKQAAQGDLGANRALTSGLTANSSPDVLSAQARVDAARLDIDRTIVRAPVSGVVTRRTIQVGQRLAAGAPAMMIVPTEQAFVDANFKEGQLARVRPGQKVTLTSDLYGRDIVYHGRVIGFSGGTGSSFALIPAQNATGNWIKVVQRLPVRIALDPKELAVNPLRVGLSMDVDVELAKN
jgi:membrane fusion protein, multidrug efflux system